MVYRFEEGGYVDPVIAEAMAQDLYDFGATNLGDIWGNASLPAGEVLNAEEYYNAYPEGGYESGMEYTLPNEATQYETQPQSAGLGTINALIQAGYTDPLQWAAVLSGTPSPGTINGVVGGAQAPVEDSVIRRTGEGSAKTGSLPEGFSQQTVDGKIYTLYGNKVVDVKPVQKGIMEQIQENPMKAGLAGIAGLFGMYDKNKANKRAEDVYNKQAAWQEQANAANAQRQARKDMPFFTPTRVAQGQAHGALGALRSGGQ